MLVNSWDDVALVIKTNVEFVQFKFYSSCKQHTDMVAATLLLGMCVSTLLC